MQTVYKTCVYDIETYPNFFLVVFKEVSPTRDRPHVRFTWDEIDELRDFLAQDHLRLAGYNSYRFDDTLLAAILEGRVRSPAEISQLANEIINPTAEQDWWWPQRETITWVCIDLMQILGGGKIAGTLKSHQVRLGMLNVVDLPIEPGTVLTDAQKAEVTAYCDNDVNATEALYFDLLENVAVREEINARYPHLAGSALRRSNASIAESIIREELTIKAAFNIKSYRKPAVFEFDPSDRVDPAIRFLSEHNQKVLQDLRRFPAFDPKEWADGLGRRFRFEIGRHKLELTAGGLHTKTGPICVRSNAILDFDVTSYYPNLLRRIDRGPSTLPDKWIDIVNSLTDKRVAAKKAGKKSEADVYKIVVNALYGKLADEYSINFDRNLQLQVVLNGQLFLMMLMERFEAAGLNVIAANTDGLYVDVGDQIEIARKIASEWEATTNFSLESKTCTIFAASSVNDYALFDPARDWFYKKGRFAVGKRSHPSVIHDAVLLNISAGTPIEQTIRERDDVRDFLFSGTVSRKFSVHRGGEEFQRTNRWYRGQGKRASLEVVADVSEGKLLSRQMPNSENAVVANRLADTGLPADLDRPFYEAEATSLLSTIMSGDGTQADADRPTLVERAEAARQLGFVVVPKGRYRDEKANIRETYNPSTITYWRNAVLTDADWYPFEGFGAYTGREFGVIALDIDVPATAKIAGIYDLIAGGGLVAWHGKGTALDVLSGKKRGTLVFRYDGSELQSTGGRFLRDYGFEILYGKRVVQLAGYHPTREPYKYAGKLRRIPQALLERLEWLIDDARSGADDAEPAAGDGLVDRLQQFLKVANSDETYRDVGGSLAFSTAAKMGVILKGVCVGHDMHTNKLNAQEMTVSVRHGQLFVDCYHHSCSAIRGEWRNQIVGKIVGPRLIPTTPEIKVISETGKRIAEAVADTARAKLIIAPTGTGKSYAVVDHVALRLAEEAADKFAIICSSKDQMQQFGMRFAEVLKTEDIGQFGIDLIEAEENIGVGNYRSRKSVIEETRVAITHYTYISRRGFGKFYYAFQKFIDENTHVFVDEVDAFVESQAFQLQLGSRWKAVSREGQTKHEMVRKCGMFHGFNNCVNCVQRMYDGFRVGLDLFSNPTYEAVGSFMNGERREPLKHIEVEHLVVQKTRVGSTDVSILRQAEDPGEMKFDDETEGDSFETRFNDHLRAAYLPTVHRSLILYDGEEIDREEVIRRYKIAGRTNLAISEQEQKRIKFPSRACNTLIVTGIDRRPIKRMAAAKSFTGLSATLTPLQKRFLSEMLQSIKVFDVEPLDDRRMDKILVVGTSQQIPTQMIAKKVWRSGKMLRFRETAAKAREDFRNLQRSGIRLKMGINTREFVISEEFGNEHDILITYSLGSLGRGVDLPSYDVVSVNASIYKPISAYVTSDPEQLRDLMNDDRANTVAQNIGRILRRVGGPERAVRLVVIEELESEDELSAIAGKLQRMSKESVESWWAPPFIDAEETCKCISSIYDQQTVPSDIPRNLEDLEVRAARLVSQGKSKKELKTELRWSTVRKRLKTEQAQAIEAKIDQMLNDRDPSIRANALVTTEKIEKRRLKRRDKIRQLMSKGQTDAQIRNNMKVYDAKQKWDSSEQDWFEVTLASERSGKTYAQGGVEVAEVTEVTEDEIARD